MTIKSSGQLAMSEIAAEFGGGAPHSLSEYYRNGGLVTANNPNVPTGGAISMSQFYGAEKSVAGSWSRTSNGTYSLTIPAFSTLTIDVRGAGGGGGGSTYDAGYAGSAGGNGGQSSVKNSGTTIIYGNGGGGGAGSYYNQAAAGSNGTASGGDTNTTGGGSNGGTGGTYGATKGGNGGKGGRAVRTFSYGENSNVAKGITLTIVVGNGGAGGAGQANGTAGTDGAVYISWT